MINTLNKIINYAASHTNEFNPSKIPATLVLEGLGEVPYSISRRDAFGGGITRISPDDPNRKMYFVQAPAPGAPRTHEVDRLRDMVAERVSRPLAFGCLFGAIVGAALFTAGALTGQGLAMLVGFTLMVSSALLLASEQQPRQPAHLPPELAYGR